jgi:hypothetical protein
MPRFLAAIAASVAVSLGAAAPAEAQAWNDARTMELVTRAAERRSRQLADTGLTSYSATALGSLTFLAQVGEGFPDPPKVVKADQIALEVYWRAPNASKQWILGRRDTLLLPTDIQYHRDHLGIVQNNFPQIIRLGEGDEVRDVPHPLSAAGLRTYDYAIGDSMRIGIPGRVIDVLEVRIRPKDETTAAAVGAVYLAPSDGQVVRMAFSFTRAALIDPQLEDVAIVLDNALIEERFWLPRRQEIEIRRRGSWLDFPARGIIRGGWEICCYQVNAALPAVAFTGPEIQLAPPSRRAAFSFEGPTASIVPPELSTVTGEDVARVQAQARSLVRQRALAPARSPSPAAGGVSDLVRANRAEGLSLGAGATWRPVAGAELSVRARYGVADERPKGSLRLAWVPTPQLSLRASVYRELRDASDFAESSGLRNTIASQEFGADYTEPYDVRGVAVSAELRGGAARAPRVAFSLAREQTDSVTVEASPAFGSHRPTPAVGREAGWRGEVSLLLPERPLWSGSIEARVSYAIRRRLDATGIRMPGRIVTALRYERPSGSQRLVLRTLAGATNSPLAQDQLRAGGPVSGPGYPLHHFEGSALLSQRVEWQVPVAFPSIPLGRWGATPGSARVAPFGTIVIQRTGPPSARRIAGYPSAGVALLAFFDLIRIDLARGLRDGRWSIGVDLSRDLWSIL